MADLGAEKCEVGDCAEATLARDEDKLRHFAGDWICPADNDRVE
jgi:hypothetical protein